MSTPVPPDLAALLRAMPKAELHVHLLGTIREATFLDLAERRGWPIGADEIRGFYVRGDKPRGVLHVLRALDAAILREPDDLRRLAREYAEDAAAHEVRHAEVFWNPTGTARLSGIPYPRAADAILAGFADARAASGISALLIPSVDREASPAEAVAVAEWMRDHPREGVAGIGIDYRENDRPPELFAEAYRIAKRAGLRATAHAGEFGMPAANVRTALELLGVDRIDHGYTALDDPDLCRRCAEAGIVFTVVPSNSYYLRTLPPERWALDHPIRHMPRHGLRVHPNSDDPTLHGVDATRPWEMMMRDFGFGLDDLRGFLLNGVDAAWAPPDRRRRWARDWAAEFDALRAGLAQGGIPGGTPGGAPGGSPAGTRA